jgi:chitinase
MMKLFLVFLFTCVLMVAGQVNCYASTVVLQWDPNTDSDLAGYRVYYKADSANLPFDGTGAVEGTSPIDVHGLTTAKVSGLDPGRTYHLAVTAYNASGVESPFSNIVTIPELVPPSVYLSYPANNISVSGTVSVTANASDNVGVTRVEYFVNGVLQATDTTTPYVYSWNTATIAAGSYTLMSKAYDAAGNVGQSTNVVVRVVHDTTSPTLSNNMALDATIPNVSVTAPKISASVKGNVLVAAKASDNVGVSKVEFYVNNVLQATDTVAPYNFNWLTTTVANGKYALTARAYDASGNFGKSYAVTVYVKNDITAPSVTIKPVTSPIGVSSLKISGTVTDNVAVAGVTVQVGTALPKAATISRRSWSCTVSGLVLGTNQITVMAKDTSGNITIVTTSITRNR